MLVVQCLITSLVYSLVAVNGVHGTKKPNIVVFMADDLGYGDVGFLGNTSLRTPHIDRVAREGAALTHHLAAAAVCTPSRAAFLTARYPIRSGMVSPYRVAVIPFVASSGGLPRNETTLATALRRDGYTTGLVGKWHLGVSCERWDDFCHHPITHGFDYFYGMPLSNLRDMIPGHGRVTVNMLQRNHQLVAQIVGSILAVLATSWILVYKKILGRTLVRVILALLMTGLFIVILIIANVRFLNSSFMRNFEFVEQPVRFENMSQRLVIEGRKFIQRSSAQGSPFFLYMSFLQVHTALHTGPEFTGHSKHSRYGDNVEEMDWCVGQILHALEERGHLDNTIVYFVSDQGGHVEEYSPVDEQREGGYNGIFRGGKLQGGMEGGIRVPAAIRWPGVVAPGRVIPEVTTMMDFYPTVMDALGLNMPKGRIIDGKSILPLLKGTPPGARSPHKILYHYCDTSVHSARLVAGDKVYKVHYATPVWRPGTEGCGFACPCAAAQWHDQPLVYEINGDPRETRPLDPNSDGEVASAVEEIREGLQRHAESITPTPSQFSIGNMLWKPWLQPCCNFPLCDCIDEQYAWLTQPEQDN